jgi:hypothetical protein
MIVMPVEGTLAAGFGSHQNPVLQEKNEAAQRAA